MEYLLVLHESLIKSAIASCKQIDDKNRETERERETDKRLP